MKHDKTCNKQTLQGLFTADSFNIVQRCHFKAK